MLVFSYPSVHTDYPITDLIAEVFSSRPLLDKYCKYLSVSLSTGSPTCLAKVLGIYQVTTKNEKGGKEVRMDLMAMENLLFRRNYSGNDRNKYKQLCQEFPRCGDKTQDGVHYFADTNCCSAMQSVGTLVLVNTIEAKKKHGCLRKIEELIHLAFPFPIGIQIQR
jgi:hypothetical protein